MTEKSEKENNALQIKYKVNSKFNINCGFTVNNQQILQALKSTNHILEILPASLYRTIDYKTTSSIIGAIFCNELATLTNSIVNPIEKGHPDIIPQDGASSSEKILRNYPDGLEVKCTIGSISQGANLRAGQARVKELTGITWQAHHREVKKLLGLVWDFVESKHEFNYPKITAIFYADDLSTDDWGKISGNQDEGRNTKVTAMITSGKYKMGKGWVALLEQEEYMTVYQKLLKFKIN